jgi:hypothetical protein
LNFIDRLQKNTQKTNFMKILPVGAQLLHADRETNMKKIIFAFRNFANAPKNIPWPWSARICILIICIHIPIYIQQDATLHSLFYLETALHVSGATTTHHQERKQLYLQHLVFVTPLLLSAAIVNELELV